MRDDAVVYYLNDFFLLYVCLPFYHDHALDGVFHHQDMDLTICSQCKAFYGTCTSNQIGQMENLNTFFVSYLHIKSL